MLGLNEISLIIAKKMSKSLDIVILNEESQNEIDEFIDIDVIIENIEEGLYTTLNKYNFKDSDYFLAITENNEYNLFASDLAKKLGAGKTVAFIYNMDYFQIDMEIDLIFNPYQILINQIQSRIEDTRLSKIRDIIPGKINLTNLRIRNEDSLSYLKVKNIELEQGLILAIKRGNKMVLPDLETIILPGDLLYVLGRCGMVSKIFKLFKRYLAKKKLFILGGDTLGLILIDYWENFFDNIILIDSNLEKCNILASKLEKPLIIYGDGIDSELLKEEGLDKESVFLAVSQNDQLNLLSSFTAQKLGCKDVITLIYHSSYKRIADLLDLKNVFQFPELIADYIDDFLKKGTGLDKYILGDQIYTSHIKIEGQSKLIGKKLHELRLPGGIIVGVIIRRKDVIIPTEETQIKRNDKFIIFYYRRLDLKVKQIFR